MLKIWDADDFRRTLAGVSCALAPAALLGSLLVHPGEGDDGLLASVAAEPGRIQVAALLVLACAVFIVPAMIGIAHLVRGRGVVLVHLGAALTIVGAIGHAVFAGFQIVLAGTITSGVDPAELEGLVEEVPNAGFVVVLLTFLVGFMPGLLLVAAALWRSKVVAGWVPLGLVAIVATDFLPTDNRMIGAIAPAFGLVCFAAIGRVLLTTSNDEWRLGRTDTSEPADDAVLTS
jgi:hypothetical protein